MSAYVDPRQEFDCFNNVELSTLIYLHLCKGAVVWDAKQTSRAIAELDRRFNRS